MSKTCYLLILIVSSLILHSCSALSNSQKIIFQQFAASGKAYSDAPKAVLNTSSQCLYKSAQLDAAISMDTSIMLNKLDLSTDQYFKRINFSEKLNLSYQLLSQYFQALTDLMSVDTASDLKTNIGTLGSNLDSLSSKLNKVRPNLNLPIGFGTIAGTLIKFAGKKWISHKELVDVRKFVAKGDSLVEKLSSVMSEIIIHSLLQGELLRSENDVRSNFNIYLAKLDSASKNSSNFYKDINPIYLNLKSCFGQASLLCKKLDEATQRLTAAHKEMVQILSINKAKNITSNNIAVFTDIVTQLTNLMNQFKPSTQN